MNEPDIAPLARRLAEENNVEWRRLEGSGDGGRIVERDVLTFLAKVMAGEEDLDPTPEPVPEGMQAWPDADVAAYRAAAAAPPVERSVTATLDDDLFLFDEAVGAAPAARSDDVPPVFDEPDVAATAPEAVHEAVPESVATEDDDGLLLVDEPEASDDGVAASADEAEDGEDVFAFDEPAAKADERHVEAPDLPDLFETEPTVHATSDDALFVDEGAPADDVQHERTLILDLDDRRAADASALDGGEVVARRRADDFADTEMVPDEPLGFVIEDETGDVGPAADRPAHPLESGAVALVRHGQVWRRRFDDRAFRSAVSQIADALDAAPSTVAVALLARAVRRAWPDAGTVDGWWWADGGAHRRAVATDGRIADAIGALEAPDDGAGGRRAPIVVADLSAIALDEAVLHLESPVLALGRATGDGAWLTLSGDDVPQGAVAVLGRVSEALGAPVRLLV